MSKLKVGDRVIAIKPVDGKSSLVGKKGTVVKMNDSLHLPLGVSFDDWTGGHSAGGLVKNCSGYNGREDDFELIANNKTIMEKVNIFAQKALSADLRAQIRAGLRHSDLSFTSKGIDVLHSIQADTLSKELTAAAKDIIEEVEKNK